MPGFIGFPEILLLGLLALILFGPKRLPEMGRGLGKGMREFKESIGGGDKHDADPFDTSQFNVRSEDEPVVVHELADAHGVTVREVEPVVAKTPQPVA